MNPVSGIAEGQVLQRLGRAGASVLLAGETANDGPLLLTLLRAGRVVGGWNRRKAGKARGGGYAFRARGIPAGGPYSLRLEDADGRVVASVRSFYVGDVWILAGQSNMEGSGALPSFSKPHPRVRVFSLRREWAMAREPLHVQFESPDACHHGGRQIDREQARQWRERATIGSGPGLAFGRARAKRTGVPQGLVCAALGGSSLSAWDPGTKDGLYASMLASVRATGQPVAGMLWYQGESDTGETGAAGYTEKMKRLVAAVRRDLRDPALPWAMVQLARVARAGTGEFWNDVQERQRRLPGVISRLATVAAIDLSLDDEIHIGAADQPRVGARLACAAGYLTGETGARPPPALREARRTVSTEDAPAPKCGVDVFFDDIEGGLRADGEPSGFYLVDAQGAEIPWIFKTTLHGDHARLHLLRPPPTGARVGYGRGYFPRCNLTDGRDLALPVFAPVEIGGMDGLLPFVTTWRVSPVIETSAEVTEVAPPDFTTLEMRTKTAGADGFVNEHEAWRGKSGHAWFTTRVQSRRACVLQFLMGYDGPFRLWLDGRPFFTDARGENPCVADESGKVARLRPGRHEIAVCMDLAHGKSWGFFLRFRELGKRHFVMDEPVHAI